MESTSNETKDLSEEFKLICFSRFLSTTYDLSKELQNKLFQHGFRTKNDLLLFPKEELFQKLNLNETEIVELKQNVYSSFEEENFSTAWNCDSKTQFISSGCKGFDAVFGGQGLPTGKLIQISGEAGVGKSQICLQLCFRVQLDCSVGGLDSEALYIDTEDGFRSERICQIASNYYKSFFDDNNLLSFKTQEVLTRIHVRKINTNADDLRNILINGQLDLFLDSYSNIKLIIIDSISYHFRYDYEYENDFRTQQLLEIASKLKQIAFEKNIAILISNQVKLENKPALGLLWNSTCSTSLILSRNFVVENQSVDGEDNSSRIKLKKSLRKCLVLKSPTMDDKVTFNYVISKNGIEDES